MTVCVTAGNFETTSVDEFIGNSDLKTGVEATEPPYKPNKEDGWITATAIYNEE